MWLYFLEMKVLWNVTSSTFLLGITAKSCSNWNLHRIWAVKSWVELKCTSRIEDSAASGLLFPSTLSTCSKRNISLEPGDHRSYSRSIWHLVLAVTLWRWACNNFYNVIHLLKLRHWTLHSKQDAWAGSGFMSIGWNCKL